MEVFFCQKKIFGGYLRLSSQVVPDFYRQKNPVTPHSVLPATAVVILVKQLLQILTVGRCMVLTLFVSLCSQLARLPVLYWASFPLYNLLILCCNSEHYITLFRAVIIDLYFVKAYCSCDQTLNEWVINCNSSVSKELNIQMGQYHVASCYPFLAYMLLHFLVHLMILH